MWRFHWADEKVGDDWMKKRRPEGLVMSEALTRASPADDAERDALVALLTAIETGAITGGNRGFETLEERQEEEGG